LEEDKKPKQSNFNIELMLIEKPLMWVTERLPQTRAEAATCGRLRKPVPCVRVDLAELSRCLN
jgi:hypothetical protein